MNSQYYEARNIHNNNHSPKQCITVHDITCRILTKNQRHSHSLRQTGRKKRHSDEQNSPCQSGLNSPTYLPPLATQSSQLSIQLKSAHPQGGRYEASPYIQPSPSIQNPPKLSQTLHVVMFQKAGHSLVQHQVSIIHSSLQPSGVSFLPSVSTHISQLDTHISSELMHQISIKHCSWQPKGVNTLPSAKQDKQKKRSYSSASQVIGGSNVGYSSSMLLVIGSSIGCSPSGHTPMLAGKQLTSNGHSELQPTSIEQSPQKA
eukprot:TRINITY_DN3338_c1_g1_i4.p2 TRINITY_DN3338_c1_g1~~TRINITY_DN3338_c1_g1_i4.p2  ORF type:complete len:303 (+),score=32.34 TRINITY_DN3338_c1_g1_i4:130-909(+)